MHANYNAAAFSLMTQTAAPILTMKTVGYSHLPLGHNCKRWQQLCKAVMPCSI
jgi:hypothetical protein